MNKKNIPAIFTAVFIRKPSALQPIDSGTR